MRLKLLLDYSTDYSEKGIVAGILKLPREEQLVKNERSTKMFIEAKMLCIISAVSNHKWRLQFIERNITEWTNLEIPFKMWP